LASAQSLLPQIGFSGAYGATAGAGTVLAWERHAMGANPAALGPAGKGLSVAGFSPFGMDGVQAIESDAHVDGRRFGASLAYRGLRAEGAGSASAWQWQQSALLRPGWKADFALRFREESGWNGEALRETALGLGFLWRGYRFLGLGAALDVAPGSRITFPAVAMGADAGWNFPRGAAFRLCGEAVAAPQAWRWKFGAGLRLHAALSVYGGWAPESQTWAMGARFGMGGWEGFHALRRHAALGGTSLQGLRWRKFAD
jgi:hypothetical protein